jgi:hypothetical protein
MKHLSWDEVLAYVDGDALSPERQDHASSCAVCSQSIDSVRRADVILERSLLRVPPPISEGLHDRVLAAMHRSSPVPEETSSDASAISAPRRGYWKWIGAASSVAALLIVGVTLGHRILRSYQAPVQSIAMGSHTPVHPSNESGSTVNSSSKSPMKASVIVKQGPIQKVNSSAMASKNSTLAVDAIQANHVSGTVSVVVVDAAGQHVGGAHVAFVAAGKLMTTEVTASTGQTRGVHLRMPVEPLLSFVKGPHQVGRFLLVVWKTGYRPIIQYGNLLTNDEQIQTTVKLQPGNLSDLPLQVSTSARSAVINTVLPMGPASVNKSAELVQPGLDTSTGTQLDVKVTTGSHQPIAGVMVSLLRNGQTIHNVYTNKAGAATLDAKRAQPDLLQAGPWTHGQAASDVALFLVSKPGFRSVLQIASYQQGVPETVSVQLSPLRDSGTRSTAIESSGVMSETDARQFYQWVVNQHG